MERTMQTMETMETGMGSCRMTTCVAAIVLCLVFWYGLPTTQYLLLVAGLMSAVWVTWYGYDYRSSDQILVGRLNVTTWVIWTVGLVLAGLFYIYLKTHTDFGFAQRIGTVAFLWSALCMILEWIGYNVLEIKLKTNYPGLFGLELMHGPWYLKLYYLTAWILFFSLVGIW